MDQRIRDAELELKTKTRSQIEEETAYKWAARAVASYLAFVEIGNNDMRFDAAHYYEEAVEHAALADQSGEVLLAVRRWTAQHVPRGRI
jgi:hypothetical protein